MGALLPASARVSNHLNNEAGEMEVLPAVIAYDGLSLDVIVNEGREMRNSKQNEISDALLLYYGKYIDYKSAVEAGKDYLENEEALYCPVCLALDMQKLFEDKIVGNIYPFDPTAFKTERNIDNFLLGDSIIEIHKYIKCYYGDTDHYLFTSPCEKPGEDLIACSIPANTLFYSHQKRSFNEKAQTISMYAEQDFDLADYLKCIIIPEKATRYFETLLSKENLTCLKYKTPCNKPPSFYNTIVYQRYMEYIGREVSF